VCRKSAVKGLTTVIVVILLMLLVVAASGLFFYWSGRLQQTVSTQSTEELEHYTEETGKLINIEAVSNCTVYVRNAGTEVIDTSKINLLVDSRSMRFNASVSTLNPDDSASLTINENFSCVDCCAVKIVVSNEQVINVEAAELQCTA